MTKLEAIAFFMDMDECTYGGSEPIQMAIKALEQDAIPIPKGATNGDMIRTMFPDELLTSITSTLWWGDNMSFNRDWWDAPYKGNCNLSEKPTGLESEDV